LNLDQKQQRAFLRLAEPIDFLTAEELATTELEDEVNCASAHLRKLQSEETDLPEDTEIEALESENYKRKIMLATRKTALEEQAATFASRSRQLKTTQLTENRREKQPTVATDSVRAHIEELSRTLERRQQEVDQKESNIDSLSREHVEIRRKMNQEFQGKTKSLQSLTNTIKENEILSGRIRDLGRENDEFRGQIAVLKRKIAQIHRWTENVERDKSRNAKFSSEIENLRAKLGVRQREIQEKSAELRERQEQLKAEELPIEEWDRKVNEETRKVVALEQETTDVGNAVEYAMKGLHEEENRLTAILASIPVESQDQFEGLRDLFV
jgi:chromosome segregation ATPase